MYKYTKRFEEVASIYIKNGEITKSRSGVDTSKEGIKKACKNRDKVIIQNENTIECYFRDEDKFIIQDILEVLDKYFSMDLTGCVEFK